MRTVMRGFAGVVLAIALVGAVQRPAGARAPVALPPVSAVSTVGFTVADMARSIAFYTEVLPFEKVSDIEVAGDGFERLHGVFGARARVVRLRLGRETIELTEYRAPRGRPMPADSRGNDLWFQHIAIVVSDMSRAYTHLAGHGVGHASTGPQRLPDWNPNAGGIEAFYFRDPDGHFLEILAFPPGKGLPAWHQPSPPLFMGIDHTAIVSSDTERSLGFYRDVLGLRVAGESENHGAEQEHLNNVFGARLRITTLRAPGGPGIELLEYLAPRDGRPAPLDIKAHDVAHWQTTVETTDVEPMLALSRRFLLVSPVVADVTDTMLGFARGVLVRDLDGHAIRVVTGTRGSR